MNKILKGFAALSLMGALTGCDDFKFGNAFLEKPVSDELNMDTVFGNKLYAEQQLMNVYRSLPDHTPIDGRLSWAPLESITDLADCIKGAGTAYHAGNLSAADASAGAYSMDYTGSNPTGNFSAVYGIRQAHIFLENIDRVPDMTEEEKTRRKGEAKLIIAYHYVDMLRNYGGMPWIDHAYTPDENMQMTRLTVAEAVEKIGTLLDEAARMLPWSVSAEDAGRMTGAGAMGLKSRMMTFVASPLFNSDQPYLEGEAADNHFVWWGNYDKNRWKDALDAGLDFLRANAANGNNRQLVDNGDPRKSFYTAYFERANSETLVTSHRYVKWNYNNYNVSQIRFGTSVPTLALADLYEMKNGEPFNWEEHSDNAFFDENLNEIRDPRLYETLIVTGDKFWGRKAEIYKGGRDYPKKFGGAPGWKFGDMGVYGAGIRKYFQDFDTELLNYWYQCCLMRLPEIYLNIAEAMNELGKANEKDEFGRTAYDYINLVRNRVDMPDVTSANVAPGEALREYILDERAREFAYEEVRYYDINRWKHKDYLEKPVRKFKTEPVGNKVNGNYVKFDYEITEGGDVQRVWVNNWSNKYYLCPIPLAEINKKYGLVQNPGWE